MAISTGAWPLNRRVAAVRHLMAKATIYVAPFLEGPSPEELKLMRRATRRYGLFAPHLLRAVLVKQSSVVNRLKHPMHEPG